MNDQLTEADLKRLAAQGKHHEIVQAQQEGRLNAVLGLPVRDIPREGQLTSEHLAKMTPAEIVEAHDAGRLNQLLGAPDDAA
ncbi:hypothetical protein [Streptomyces sp. JB150]|uniref:hypothetical protein n=1 Tax=Streptomyces sp. JB150 TaxID=2714844 RepID=UPI00140B37B7|nr:hypothetical protein [Streptomyces sp. JB150]QIJ62224.1 hypothetical protein G7Z13_09325 [Streptomyces sp. JB150]